MPANQPMPSGSAAPEAQSQAAPDTIAVVETLARRVAPLLPGASSADCLSLGHRAYRRLAEQLAAIRSLPDEQHVPGETAVLARAAERLGESTLAALIAEDLQQHPVAGLSATAREERLAVAANAPDGQLQIRQMLLALSEEAGDGRPNDAAARPAAREGRETGILRALAAGDCAAATALLASAALVPNETVEAAIALRNARGMVSLAWKAGFSMRLATLLQIRLAGIPPEDALVALPDGGCPLSRSEMLWQLGLLAQSLR